MADLDRGHRQTRGVNGSPAASYAESSSAAFEVSDTDSAESRVGRIIHKVVAMATKLTCRILRTVGEETPKGNDNKPGFRRSNYAGRSFRRIGVDMMKRQFTAIVEREGDGYVSLCPELDIASQGDTIEKARENLQQALGVFFETASPSEVQTRFHEEMYVTRVEVAIG
jgi:predicted RNase H-like HicB family nuclease